MVTLLTPNNIRKHDPPPKYMKSTSKHHTFLALPPSFGTQFSYTKYSLWNFKGGNDPSFIEEIVGMSGCCAC